jgi:hypothetical protein
MDPSICVYCLRSENPEISVRCDACKSSMHFKCIGLSSEEISFFKKPHSTNIKIVCTRCNITPLNVIHVSNLLTRFQHMIVQRLEDLQDALEMYLMAISMQREDAESNESANLEQEDNLVDANISNNSNDDDNAFVGEFMADLNGIAENEEPAYPPVNQNDDDGNKVVQLNFPPSPNNNDAEVDVPPPHHNFQPENIAQCFYNYKNLILRDLRGYMEDIQTSIARMTA